MRGCLRLGFVATRHVRARAWRTLIRRNIPRLLKHAQPLGCSATRRIGIRIVRTFHWRALMPQPNESNAARTILFSTRRFRVAPRLEFRWPFAVAHRTRDGNVVQLPAIDRAAQEQTAATHVTTTYEV